MVQPAPVLVWFRRDLRLTDQPALNAAVESGRPVIPVYIEPEPGPWAPGAASRWWLHHSLASLAQSFHSAGSRLILRRGDEAGVLSALVKETGADELFFCRHYEPESRQKETAVRAALDPLGVNVRDFNGTLLWEPSSVQTGQGRPYQVFTPFWSAVRQRPPLRPRPAPRAVPAPSRWPSSLSLSDFNFLPALNWADGFSKIWKPGERGAENALRRFASGPVKDYTGARDRPSEAGTSRLSPHLHFGEISPATVWSATEGRGAGSATYLKELAWREFAYHLLFHFPHTTDHPLRESFKSFPWKTSPGELRAWQRGQTGYPIVDAGLRELWTTGWMHNRVRMIVASFLVKDLRLSWLEGARWFWDTLVDADLANNTLGWQWSAGCGADAAPYFRIFNPVIQGERFDPAGIYVRRWVPEIKRLSDKWIHKPWMAPEDELHRAGVAPGKNYPAPLVDHARARDEALSAFQALKRSTSVRSY